MLRAPEPGDDESQAFGSSPKTTSYNFHGLFSVRVEHAALDKLMRAELGAFVESTDHPDLIVAEGEVPLPEAMLATDYFFDDESLVVNADGGRIRVTDGHIVAEPGVSDEVLVDWVENLMRVAIPARGAVLVHGSAVARDGRALMFPAWGQTGKTTVALAFLRAGYDHLSDDWCFLTSAGEILSFPRWLNLFRGHFDAHPFLRDTVSHQSVNKDLRRRLSAVAFAESLNSSTELTRRIRRWIGSRFFVNVRVSPSTAVPGCRTVLRASLSKACLLVTSRTAGVSVTGIPPEELARKAAMSGDYERTPFRMRFLALAFARQQDPTLGEEVMRREAVLLGSALANVRCLRVTVPPRPRPSDYERIREVIEAS